MDQPGGPTELGYGGARGGGKSHWMLAQMVEDCLRFPGLKGLLLRKIGKSVKEAFEDLRPKLLSRLPHEWVPSRNMVVFPNGSRIVLGNFQNEADVDKYLGLEYDVIGVEEATTLTWRKFQAIQSVCRSSKPGWRPRIYTTTNPGGVGHAWYKNRFVTPARNGQERETRFIQATVDDNQFVNPEYEQKLNQLTGWLLRAWRYGDWDIAAGQFFTTFRHEAHVRKPFRIPDHWRVWCSMDYGYHHPTVVHLWAEDDDDTVYTVDEHFARRWQVSQHVEAIKGMLGRWDISLSRLKTFVAGHDVFAQRDEGPTVAKRYRQFGIGLKPANIDRVNGWAEMLARLGDVDAKPPIEPRWVIFETCGRLIETLPMLEHDPHRPEDVLKVDIDDDGIGGDDAGDCARYGIMAAHRATMTSRQVDWYAKTPQRSAAPQPARTDEEIEQLLSNYGQDD